MDYWLSILTYAAINALGAIGVYVTLMTGQISVAHAAFMGIGAYVAGYSTASLGVPFPLALLGAVIVCTSIATGFIWLVRELRYFYLALATLALGETLVVLAFNVSATGGPRGMVGIPLLTGWLGVTITVTVVASAVAMYERSLAGLLAQGISQDEDGAAGQGADVRRFRMASFAIGAGIAGVAGVLLAHFNTVILPTDMDFAHSLALLLFVVVGGRRTVVGAIVGALFLTVIPELFRFAASHRYLIYGASLVLVMLFRPDGALIPRPRVIGRSFAGIMSGGRNDQSPRG